jgi:hypothetical protein
VEKTKIAEFLKAAFQSPEPISQALRLVKVDSLFSIEIFREHLSNPLLSPDWLQVIVNGTAVDLRPDHLWKMVQRRKLQFLSKQRLVKAVDTERASVILEGLDILDSNIGHLAADLDAIFPCVLSHCEAFWSRGGKGGSEAYGAHRDSDDVLAIQISGQKRWRIYEPQQRRHVGNAGLDPNQLGKPIFDEILNPGDVLFVRAGTPHWCTTPGDMSLHLSFDLNDRNLSAEQINQLAVLRLNMGLPPSHAGHEEVIKAYRSILSNENFIREVSDHSDDYKQECRKFRGHIISANLKARLC